MSNISSNPSPDHGTEIEQLIRKIWLYSLEIDDVKSEDNFIKLGGDSLRAMQVITLVREDLGAEVPLARLLDACNFREFCSYVEQALHEQAE
ncbi:MAG TPA: phosphopantetheine-binding protein [Candidatus Angelobacter sp.]|jgi:acyl carrier protein|nr:phosphopantetheine-binding protein [Candidatus Angelobacter sp.]